MKLTRPAAGEAAIRSVPADPRASDPNEINSFDLLAGKRLLIIRHGLDAYRLQRTAAGKLILTK